MEARKVPLLKKRSTLILYLGPISLSLLVIPFQDWKSGYQEFLLILIAFSGISIFIWIIVTLVQMLFSPLVFDGKAIIVKKKGATFSITKKEIDFITENINYRGPSIMNIYTKTDGHFRFLVPECLSDYLVQDKVDLFKGLCKWYDDESKKNGKKI